MPTRDEEYMRIAIEMAHASRKDGGAVIGAVLVDTSGKVVATGESVVGPTHDPTAHAEVNAIRYASAERGDDDLRDMTLYSTLEPCHMCLSAAAWARIPLVVFGAYRKDVHHDSYFDMLGNTSDEAEAEKMNIHSHAHMVVKGGVLESECTDLLYKKLN